MRIVKLYKNNQEIDVISFEKKERLNKFKKISIDYIVNNEYKIEKTDYIDFECSQCHEIRHQCTQKMNLNEDVICTICSKKNTRNENKNSTSKFISNINILKAYSENKEILVNEAHIEEYEGKKKEIFKRIVVNNTVLVKNDYIEFECCQCHQIKKQQIRNSRQHLFQEFPVCGDCFYKNNVEEKYGVDNVWKSKEVQEKIKQTNLERYGSENVLGKESIIKEKIKNIMFEKYGVYHNFENGILREKIKQTNLDRYGSEYYVETEKFRQQMSEFEYQTYSKVEKELSDWIKSIGIQIDENNRSVITPLELDIYIPSHNLAIEFDGLYWHCDLFKDENYHLQKTELCEAKGVRLIHIFEDEWMNKQEIVKSRIKNMLGLNTNRIGARKTEIKEIDSKIKNEFLEKYHIQGSDNSSIRLGAYYQNDLIGVMTFGKGRKFTNNSVIEGKYELIRFTTISDTYTPGLASKMLHYFISNYNPKEIYSYADRRWSQGKVYESIGFTFQHFTKPNYWYFNEIKRINRFMFRKSELKNMFPEIYSDDKTEFEMMNETDYLRIYDCGNYKYTLKIE